MSTWPPPTRCHFSDGEIHSYCLDVEGAEAQAGKWFGDPLKCVRCGESHPDNKAADATASATDSETS